jgi:hypothetical protein
MPIDPRIAMGYQAPQLESPVNMMMMAQKLQSGQQENALRQAQMENYQAEAARRNALLPAELAKAKSDADAAALLQRKTAGDIASQKTAAYKMLLPNFAKDPNSLASWYAMQHDDPDMAGTPVHDQPLDVLLSKIPQDAPGFAKHVEQTALGMDKWLENERLKATGAETERHNRQTEKTATAAAQADKAPTVTTIRDPNDPNRNLQIDARTYRGGSVGDAGVLGESSKPTETAKLDARELAKREAAYPQATTAVKSVEGNTDALITKLKTLRDHPGLSGMTGLIAGRTPNITGPAREAQALYKQIMATGQFGVLQALRESSKTGGALGNVSDTEGKALRDSFGALDQTQDTPSFQKGIDAAITDLERTKRTVKEGYDATYEYKSGGNGRAAPAAPAAAASGWGEAKVK